MTKLHFKILRYNPKKDTEPFYQDYELEAKENDRVLDCLNKIRWEQDPTLSYRWSCGHGICGSDGMTINGEAALACQKLVKEYDSTSFTIEPLGFFPIIKDLVVDMEGFFDRMKKIHPNNWTSINPVDISREIRQSINEHDEIKEAIKCILCGVCTASCPVNLDEDPEYIGPAAVLRSQLYIMDSRMKDIDKRIKKVDNPQGVWGCKVYGKCTIVCPKNIKVTKKIIDLKRYIKEG